jgi:UDP-3-O-[3-hydroxymyristoyl] glucosamine N-acyltransferase
MTEIGIGSNVHSELPDDAKVGTDVTIGRNCTFGDGFRALNGSFLADRVQCGDGATVGICASLGNDVVVGQGVTIHAYATIGDGCEITRDVLSYVVVPPGFIW